MTKKRIPISIHKIKTKSYNDRSEKETVKYLIEVNERDHLWKKSFVTDRDFLIRFRDEIDSIINDTSVSEILGVSAEEGELIEKHHSGDKLCENCPYKMTFNCKICLLELQSPLERKLFLALRNENIIFRTQYPLSWNGEFLNIDTKNLNLEKVKFHNILTIPDFFIEQKGNKLCVYTDGHTYHERTEEQAKRDRNIDRRLQSLGFVVLRYTGKEVNENLKKIIDEISSWIKK